MINTVGVSPQAREYIAKRTIQAMRSESEASRELHNNPIIRLAEAVWYYPVARIKVKRAEDWQELKRLWMQSGMRRYKADIMWNGVPIVAAWDC